MTDLTFDHFDRIFYIAFVRDSSLTAGEQNVINVLIDILFGITLYNLFIKKNFIRNLFLFTFW